MSQQAKPSAPTSFQFGAVRGAHKSRDRFMFGVFVMLTTLAFVLATPAPLRAAFADVLSGFLSGLAEGWHGETVASVLSPASYDR